MNYLLKTNKLLPRSAVFFLISGFVFIAFLWGSPEISAQTTPLTKPQALVICEKKVNVAACKTRVNKCAPATSACLKNAVRVGEGVPITPPPAGATGRALSLAANRTTSGQCGEGDNAVKTSIDLGCKGIGNPIVDMAYAAIRFLSVGVGLIIAASIIYAGIMYTSSTGNPDQTSAAKKRIQNAFVALIFYLLIFVMIQYLVPGGLFKN